jgi:iron complex transport system ATP-binding protein
MPNSLPEHLLEVGGVSVIVGGVSIIRECSFYAPRHGLTAILGPTGSGKSTMMLTCSGLLPPDAGSVRVNGEELYSVSTAVRASLVSYIPQRVELYQGLTASEVVMSGRSRFLGRFWGPSASDRASVERCLELLSLASLRDRRFGSLSGGEQQLVLLASALAQEAPLLLLDEPTASLDLVLSGHIIKTIKQLCAEEGITAVMITHDCTGALSYADWIVSMQGGTVLFEASPKELRDPSQLSQIYSHPVRELIDPKEQYRCIVPE